MATADPTRAGDVAWRRPNRHGTRRRAGGLRRDLTWRDVFWVASGVPPLVLFSIGGIAATIGNPSWVVWIVSVLMGYVQAHTYAEIAGLFPSKSGGASVYGAAAWVRYGRIIAPLSVWCNWIAWSPVLAIGSGIAAGYIFTSFFAADSAILAWSIPLADLSFLKDGLALRINATSILGTVPAADRVRDPAPGHPAHRQDPDHRRRRGDRPADHRRPRAAADRRRGDEQPVPARARWPRTPPALPIAGEWTNAGWTLFLGGMFIAAWSTYGFETAVCYTSELKDPQRDTAKGIIYAGLLCILIFTLVPLSFQGTLGLGRLLEPGIYDGSGVAAAMGDMVGGGALVHSAARDHADPGADALDHDHDGRLLAHALPGLGRRLAAEVPQRRQRARRADPGDVDRPRLQPDPAHDVGLRVRAGRLQRLLPRLQLPQPERRLDPPDRQRQGPPAVARADLHARRRRGAGLRQHGLPRRRREGLGSRHAGLGPGRHGSRGARSSSGATTSSTRAASRRPCSTICTSTSAT